MDIDAIHIGAGDEEEEFGFFVDRLDTSWGPDGTPVFSVRARMHCRDVSSFTRQNKGRVRLSGPSTAMEVYHILNQEVYSRGMSEGPLSSSMVEVGMIFLAAWEPAVPTGSAPDDEPSADSEHDRWGLIQI